MTGSAVGRADSLADDRPAASVAGTGARFLAAGGVSVVLDVGVLYLLHAQASVWLPLATALAFGVSLGVNYVLNHQWVFGAVGGHRRRLVRYLVLVGVNWVSTVALVSLLSHAGLYYLLAKLIAVAVNAAMNFVAYRAWVFR